MSMFKRLSPNEREMQRLVKREQAYIEKRVNKKDSALNKLLADKVPVKLQSTLDQAFAKAFSLVFEKGTAVIEKTYNREKLQQDYMVNEYASEIKQNHKSLKAFRKKAGTAGTVNLVLSGVSGVGLGVLGIGLPDIVLFTGIMLKGLYEIALNYGYEYESDQEKRFILLLIQGALASGEQMQKLDAQINLFLQQERFETEKSLEEMIAETAAYLSQELLYMKFLQGIPIAGAIGGAYDAIYMKQVMEYGELKYRRRFLQKREHL